MQSGKLRHRFTIKTYTENLNDYGEDEQTPATFASRWGSLKAVNGDEKDIGDKVTAAVTHEIRIRYLSGLLPSMWLTLGTGESLRTFEIERILPDRTDKRNQLILAIEKID